MPTEALLLALAAALLHALWNLILAGAKDSQAAAAVALPISVLAFAPAAVVMWDVDGEAAPYIAASSALHLAYFGLLTAAYRRAELSLVYPLSRGLAPVLVLAVTASALSQTPSAAQAAGVFLVAAGVVLVPGLGRPTDAVGLALALAIGACIAAYTLVDKVGMQHAAPVPYLEFVLLPGAAIYVAALATIKGRRPLAAEVRLSTAAAGVAMFAAYALVLAALALAPAAPVAAVRETSVVIATALAAKTLREQVTRFRLLGAVLVAGGILVLGGG